MIPQDMDETIIDASRWRVVDGNVLLVILENVTSSVVCAVSLTQGIDGDNDTLCSHGVYYLLMWRASEFGVALNPGVTSWTSEGELMKRVSVTPSLGRAGVALRLGEKATPLRGPLLSNAGHAP